MTAVQLRALRQHLDLTVQELADELRLTGPNAACTVRKWESGKKPITGPASRALELMAEKAGIDLTSLQSETR